MASVDILLLNYEFPPLGGGAGTASWETSRALVRAGCSVTVVTSAFSDLPVDESSDGVRILRIPVRRRRMDTATPIEMSSFVLSALRRVPRIVREVRPHVLLCFFSIPSGIIGWRVRRTHGIPYIISLRGGDVPGLLPEVLSTYHRLTMPITKTVWRDAAAVSTNAVNLRDLALRVMPDLDVAVIPNGVDMDRFHPPAVRNSDASPVALFSGRFNIQKGLGPLLTAIHSVKDQLPAGFRLILVGTGPEEPMLRKMSADFQLENMLDFRGWLTREQMPAAYREADFFVLPSLDEGMPNVILEAMASGLPVITTDIPGCLALVEHDRNGIIVRRGASDLPDVSALAAALLRLASDAAARRAMADESLRRAREFSWDSVAQRYIEIIQTVVKS